MTTLVLFVIGMVAGHYMYVGVRDKQFDLVMFSIALLLAAVLFGGRL